MGSCILVTLLPYSALGVLESVRQGDARPVRRLRHRIEDRFGPGLDDAGYREVADPRCDVRREKDRLELRLVHLGERRCQRIEDGGGGAAPPGKYGQDRLTLLLVGALVDDRLTLAVAVMDRTRPGEERHPVQPVQPDVAEMPVVDPHGHGRTAITPARELVELARAAPIAAAGAQFRSLMRQST